MIDIQRLTRIVTTLSQNSERIRQLADDLGVETKFITYEQLQHDPVGTFRSVFQYLGVPPPKAGSTTPEALRRCFRMTCATS